MTALARTSRGLGLTGTVAAHGIILLVCLLLGDQATPTPLPPPVEAVRISLTEPVAAPAPQLAEQPEPQPEPEPAPPVVEEKTPVVEQVKPLPEKPKPPRQKSASKPQAKPVAAQTPQTAVPPPPAQDAAVKEARQTLLSALIARIEKEKRYPTAARRLGLEGQITAVVRVDAQGRIVSVGVQGAGAHAILEKATEEALNRVRSNWNPVPVPEAMTLRIPIRYTLS